MEEKLSWLGLHPRTVGKIAAAVIGYIILQLVKPLGADLFGDGNPQSVAGILSGAIAFVLFYIVAAPIFGEFCTRVELNRRRVQELERDGQED